MPSFDSSPSLSPNLGSSIVSQRAEGSAGFPYSRVRPDAPPPARHPHRGALRLHHGGVRAAAQGAQGHGGGRGAHAIRGPPVSPGSRTRETEGEEHSVGYERAREIRGLNNEPGPPAKASRRQLLEQLRNQAPSRAAAAVPLVRTSEGMEVAQRVKRIKLESAAATMGIPGADVDTRGEEYRVEPAKIRCTSELVAPSNAAGCRGPGIPEAIGGDSDRGRSSGSNVPETGISPTSIEDANMHLKTHSAFDIGTASGGEAVEAANGVVLGDMLRGRASHSSHAGEQAAAAWAWHAVPRDGAGGEGSHLRSG